MTGTAHSNATVTVNYQRAQRKGEYFRKELAVDNQTGPVWQAITNLGVLNQGTNADIVTTNLGHVYLPPASETFTQDADGDTLSDGRWSYTWDAEHRLVALETTTAAATNGVPQ